MGELQKKKILYSKFGSLDDIFSVKDVDSFRLHHVLVVCRNCQRIILMFQTSFSSPSNSMSEKKEEMVEDFPL